MYFESLIIGVLVSIIVGGTAQNSQDWNNGISQPQSGFEINNVDIDATVPSYISDDEPEIAYVVPEPPKAEGIIIPVPPNAWPTEGICPAPDPTSKPKVPERHLACCTIYRHGREISATKLPGVGRDCFWITPSKRCHILGTFCCENIINPTPDEQYTTIADECTDPLDFSRLRSTPSVIKNFRPLRKQGACPIGAKCDEDKSW